MHTKPPSPPPRLTQAEYKATLQRLWTDIEDTKLEHSQSIGKNFALTNLLNLEKTKRAIFGNAVEAVRERGFHAPGDLVRRYLFHDGGVDNFQRN
jgi:hypothetical protein